MATHPQHPVEELSVDECWQLLDATPVGRLAIAIANHPDIFPVNYIVHEGALVFRSGAGTKLAGSVLGRSVALEIDGADPRDRSVWSVVVKGWAREITNMAERFAADELPLYPWLASSMPNFVQIDPQLVTGRRFHVVESADVDHALGVPADFAVETDARKSRPVQPHHEGAPQLSPD